MRYNERKLEVLDILNKERNLTARQILDRIDEDITMKCLTALLTRYHRFGYLHREKNHNKFIYKLNPCGIKKLNWLMSVIV